MWKGSISFGLVNIPIKLHAAVQNKSITFRNLHKDCHSPVKYEKVCPVCEEEVEQADIVKGYEIAKGEFVVFEEDELNELKKATEDRAVEMIDFIKLEEIDPIYFNRSYYVSPNEGGSKAYNLLRKALEETGKAGIAKIVMRSKEQLAVIRVFNNTLLMETIHYPDEVRNATDVPNISNEAKVVKKELETAILLIDQLTTTFEPENYTDEYRSELMELIEAKQAGKTVKPKEKAKDVNVTDLMAALQASIDKTKPKQTKKRPAKRKTTAKKKAE